ncbi:CRISPR-associated endonuclease Cas1 [Flavobacterium bizetiae]|uniref:CRISPR-associated endonuclease Cas1 n=1 Tax=Flavobacterium bizetiae TaxID=2704140 RepID=A0A6J4GYA8_9FLAO|nr:type II CRISPR-associated endonuclease Cas1 [Flavobacterium bizetiae]CAA9202952.1 CRISPR-associated endonuclease Cas1 [Flavobacterium bizetiae]CAD5343578.1 CRISPR-associated endonuclease Cas1 [Flavobacterium bizetiae]CAD5349573.1 CRISPR-associated endonuclease Cas1 [Flavobacterium bizetiae]
MIKRTLFFGNPAYLSTKNEQIVISYPDKDQEAKTVSIEDVGVIVLENQQITITNGLLEKLTHNNVALINCDQQHLPIGLLMPLSGHTEQTERFKNQINASVPLKKNLWQQTISSKITNQAGLLKEKGIPMRKMELWAKEVTSGDSLNHEARAAVYYWQSLIKVENFTRGQKGIPPNNLLNYGYSILRAITARALVSSGMLPTLGIFHRNKYNAYCLADDIMEPYRPYVDLIVCHIMETVDSYEELTVEIKKQLLNIATIDVNIDGKNSPLMVAMSRTTNSLHECFDGSSRRILYPIYV